MANNVHLEDFSRMVIEAVKEAGVAILHEAAGEVVSQTQRNLGREMGQMASGTKGTVAIQG